MDQKRMWRQADTRTVPYGQDTARRCGETGSSSWGRRSPSYPAEETHEECCLYSWYSLSITSENLCGTVLSMGSPPDFHTPWRLRAKVLCRHQLTSPHSMSGVGVFFSMGSWHQFMESNLQSWQQTEMFRSSQGAMWPTAQLDVTQSWYLKFHLVTRDNSVRLHLPGIGQFYLEPLHICIDFTKLLLYYIFMSFKKTLIFVSLTLLSLYPLNHPITIHNCLF